MRIEVGARSDVGRVRRRNEDAYLVRAPLFAVADGMGGHRGGNVASAMSLQTLEEASLTTDAADPAAGLLAAVRDANAAVLARGTTDREVAGMGTTLTAVLVEPDGRAHVAHVGDSRAYLLRDGVLQRLTEDHTLVQELVRKGELRPEEAEHHPQRNIVTRALGADDQVDVDELTLNLQEGDRLLLCSDGLTGMVQDEGIRDALAGAADPQAAAERLVDLAIEGGGEDNVTVIVLFATGQDGGRGSDTTGVASSTAVAPGDDGAASGAVVADGHAETSEEPERRRPRGRVAMLSVAILVVLGVASYVAVRAYLDRQWYVGESGGNVAVFQGVPVSFLGVRFSRVEATTDLRAADAERLPVWQDVSQGIPARDRADALSIVEQMRTDVCAQAAAGTAGCAASTTPPSSPSPAPPASPTPTVS